MDRLLLLLNDILNTADEHEKEISNLVLVLKDLDGDLNETIKRRTAKLSLFLSRLIRESLKRNPSEKAKNIKPQKEAQKLIVLVESYCFHITYIPQNKDVIRSLMTDLVESYRA